MRQMWGTKPKFPSQHVWPARYTRSIVTLSSTTSVFGRSW